MGISIEQNLQIEPNIEYQSSNKYTLSSTLDVRIIKMQNRILWSELSTLNKSKFLPSFNLIGMYGTTGLGYDKAAIN